MKTLYPYGVFTRLSKVAALVIAGAGAASAKPVDLLAFGDSLTQGYGLVDGEGFVPQLQAWLRERGHDVTIVNGGVSGDTTSGGLSRVDWSLTPEIDAMIVTLGGNDVLRGLPPELTRSNLDGILEAAEARGVEVLLVGLVAPGNYGPDFAASFDAIYPDLSEKHHTLFYPDFFAALKAEGTSPEAMARFMQGDGLHPSAEGVTRIVDGIGPLVEELLQRADAE